MLFQKYLFSCTFKDEAFLPEYKGSTIRGILGIALKKLTCVLKRRECFDCALKKNCIYAIIFEIGVTDKKNLPPPLPYMIEPQNTEQTHYKKGDIFNFNLLLFGKTNELIAYFIYAVNEMGNIGMGKKIKGKRASFSLDIVSVDGENIYDKKTEKIETGNFAEDLKSSLCFPNDTFIGKEITIKTETPLRFKTQNSFTKATELSFHILIRSALRRISSLYATYDEKEPDLNYKEIIKKAEKIKIKNSDLSWFDWKRYSNRQEAKMFMGGIMGDITYEGNLSEFIPLLKLCELFHIGKQTTFGLGKIKLLYEDIKI